MFRILIASGVALAALSAAPATAQYRGYSNYNNYYGGQYQRAVNRLEQRCNRALRRADSRREYISITRQCDRQLRDLRQDYARELRRDRRGDWYDDDRRYRDRDDDDDDDDRRYRRYRDDDDDD